MMTAKIISGWITDNYEYVAFFLTTGLPELCVFLANYALFFGELCAKNPELCANYVNCTILFSMFQFIKLANQA